MKLSFPLFIASDHAGFPLKEIIVAYLMERQLNVFDWGTHTPDPVDYPDIAKSVCGNMKDDPCARAILICGSGLGICMVANRYTHIRAAKCGQGLEAEYARLHNNANVLCLGARFTGAAVALDCVDKFLMTPFEGGRHQNRLNKFSMDLT